MRKEIVYKNEIKITEDGDYIISSFKTLEIEKNVKCSLLVKDVNNFNILVNEGADLKLETLLENQIENLDFATKIEKNGTFAMFLADFADNSFSINSTTDLDGENASSSFQISSIAKDKEVKKYNISFNHNCPKTYSDLVSYRSEEHTSELQ